MPLDLVGRKSVRQTSKPSSNTSWDVAVHPVFETFDVMCAFKNHYIIKYTVAGPITSWCSKSTQSAADIKIAVTGTSASENIHKT